MIIWTRPPKIFRKIYPNSYWECWIEQNILFSFDDGPGLHTNYLLDLAAKYGVKFAFFILPEQAEKYPEIISRIVKEGHILGSHFFKHRNHFMDNHRSFTKSLNTSIQIIQGICKEDVQYCRVPYGRLFPWQERWIIKNGYQHVFWSLDSKDYLYKPKEAIIYRVQNQMRQNDIVLFHDGENSHPEIVKIVEECIIRVNFN